MRSFNDPESDKNQNLENARVAAVSCMHHCIQNICGGDENGDVDLPSCKISSVYSNPRPRYPLPKYTADRKTNRKTSTPVNLTGVYPHMTIAVAAPFVTLTFNLSRSSKVKPMGPTS